MRSLLDALQEGRLVELPEVERDGALEYLALLIEAIPDLGARDDLVKAVRDREAQFNTAIGKGVAVPHCRTDRDGELLCAVGWSPKGIDWNAPDGQPVHLIVMYYVPDGQRNLYLKEISGLAKVLSVGDALAKFTSADSLGGLREHLLDWVSQAIGEAVPDAKARMIKLEARAAAVPLEAPMPPGHDGFVPFEAVCYGDHVLVLSADGLLVDTLEHDPAFRSLVRTETRFTAAGWRVVRLSSTPWAHDRTVVSAVALRG